MVAQSSSARSAMPGTRNARAGAPAPPRDGLVGDGEQGHHAERDQIGLVALEPPHLGGDHVQGGGDEEGDGHEVVAAALPPPHHHRGGHDDEQGGQQRVGGEPVQDRPELEPRAGVATDPLAFGEHRVREHALTHEDVEGGEGAERADGGHADPHRLDELTPPWRRARGRGQPGDRDRQQAHPDARRDEEALEPHEDHHPDEQVGQDPTPGTVRASGRRSNNPTTVSTMPICRRCSMPSSTSAGRKSTPTTRPATAAASSGRRRDGPTPAGAERRDRSPRCR